MNVLHRFPESLANFFEANGLKKTDILKDLKYVPYEYSAIADQFDYDEKPIVFDEVKSAIGYLKRRNKNVHKQQVDELMGVRLHLKGQRKDIRKLFKKKGRYRIAA